MSALAIIARALRLRCPNCGAGGLFSSWFTMKPRCHACGLVMEREEGYFLGAMLFNLVIAELLFVASMAAVVLATWPNPPWNVLWIGSVTGMVLFPLAIYPFSKAVWLALDLPFRPMSVRDRRLDSRGSPDSRPYH